VTQTRRDRLRHLDQLAEFIDSIGPPAAAYGPTSAGVHSFDTFAVARPFEVFVPYRRSPRRLHHVIHRSRLYDERELVTVDGIRAASPSLTLMQLAATFPRQRVGVALDGALRDGLTSEDYLHRLIVRSRRRGREGPLALLAILEGEELARGGHSWLERTFLEMAAEAGLPRPDTQQVLAKRGTKLVRVDCRFPDTNLVVELLGYRWHRSPADLNRDSERMNALQAAGLHVLQFTYTHVVEQPQYVLDTVRSALL
jgi:Protein of unknown function (DUF559)